MSGAVLLVTLFVYGLVTGAQVWYLITDRRETRALQREAFKQEILQEMKEQANG